MQQPQTEQSAKLSVYMNLLLTHFGNEQSIEDESLIVEQPKSQTPKLNVQSLVEPLSDRELEVLHLVATGLSNTDIAVR